MKFTASTDTFSAFALTAAVGASPPSTPSGLAATNVSVPSSISARLTWSASSNSPEGYYLYRSTDNSTFALLTDAGNVTTYTDTSSLSSNTKYYYKVSAYKSSGAQESSASDAVEVTTSIASGGGVVSSGGSGGSRAPSAVVATTPIATTTCRGRSRTLSSRERFRCSAIMTAVLCLVFTNTLVLVPQVPNPTIYADPKRALLFRGGRPARRPHFGASSWQLFKIRHGLAKSGDAGYGFVGPRLAEIERAGSSSVSTALCSASTGLVRTTPAPQA